MVKEALYYEVLNGKVRCVLCPRRCRLGEGEVGDCRVRVARDGKLWATNYGSCSSVTMDPIEKKPLFHFHPGGQILSAGTVGCNLHCLFCQNWEISQSDVFTQEVTPQELVDLAARRPGNLGISYTYNEPLIWYEFVLDTAQLAKEQGLSNVLVTNGTVLEQPLLQLLPYIDAMNVDLKAGNQQFYTQMCSGFLKTTKKTIELAAEKCLVEVTNLLVTGYNDTPEEVAGLAKWLASLSPDIPFHISRYFPNYKLSAPPTPVATLEHAYHAARQHLNYVYVGNAHLKNGEDTFCKGCGKPIIRRAGFSVVEMKMRGRACAYCGTENHLVC